MPKIPHAAVKKKRRGSIQSDMLSVASEATGRFVRRDPSRQIRDAIRANIKPEMDALQLVMRSHQRRQDTNRDAHMRNFYREKYKGRYMFAMLNKQDSMLGGAGHYDDTHQHQHQHHEEFNDTRSQASSRSSRSSQMEQSQVTWSSKQARTHHSRGSGSTYTYQYSKDQHLSRGPPYHVNNSTAIWQR